MFDPRRSGPVQTELGTITHHVFQLGNHVYRHPLGEPDNIEVFDGILTHGRRYGGWRKVDEPQVACGLRRAA